MRRHPILEEVLPFMVWLTAILAMVVVLLLLLVFVFPVGVVAIVVVILIAWRSIRLNRQRAFLLTLSVAMEHGVPLVPALRAFGEEHFFWRSRIRRLSSAISHGMPLAEALRLLRNMVPLDSVPLIEAGDRAGRLAQALKQAVERNDRTGPASQAIAMRVFYLLCVLLILSLVWIFIAVKILPAYQKIFEDFDMRLPELTQVAFNMSEFFYDMGPLVALAGLVAFAFFVYGALCYVGLISFDLPVLRRFARRLDTASILDTLAFSVDASQPIPTAFAALSAEYPRRSIRRRVRRVWLAVAEGREWCDGLVSTGLLTQPDAGVLESAARASNLPWAMREVADSNRRRFDCRVQAATQILFPITAGVIGLTVCFFVVGCFLPLVKLIECLS